MANERKADSITWRWRLNDVEIPGEENFAKVLTEFSGTTKRGRGRPSEIGDDELRRAFNELRFVLEENWAIVGWALRRAKEPEDIPTAFSGIAGITCPWLDPFRETRLQSSTARELRQSRHAMAEVHAEVRTDYAAMMCAEEIVTRAASSLSTERDCAKMDAVRLIGAKAGRKLENARASFQASQERLQSAQAEQTAREAYFAQSQLLKFLQSGRRELTPSNIAMAMAGLPRICARVSCERCSAWKPMARPGHAYLMFQAVETIFRNPPAEAGTALEMMRAHLLDQSRADRSHVTELRRNWYFLKTAVESVYPVHVHPRGSIPYRIFAEYKRLMMAQNPADNLLAEANRL